MNNYENNNKNKIIYNISSFTFCWYKKNNTPRIIKSSRYSLMPNISKIACSESEINRELVVLLTSIGLVILSFSSFFVSKSCTSFLEYQF